MPGPQFPFAPLLPCRNVMRSIYSAQKDASLLYDLGDKRSSYALMTVFLLSWYAFVDLTTPGKWCVISLFSGWE